MNITGLFLTVLLTAAVFQKVTTTYKVTEPIKQPILATEQYATEKVPAKLLEITNDSDSVKKHKCHMKCHHCAATTDKKQLTPWKSDKAVAEDRQSPITDSSSIKEYNSKENIVKESFSSKQSYEKHVMLPQYEKPIVAPSMQSMPEDLAYIHSDKYISLDEVNPIRVSSVSLKDKKIFKRQRRDNLKPVITRHEGILTAEACTENKHCLACKNKNKKSLKEIQTQPKDHHPRLLFSADDENISPKEPKVDNTKLETNTEIEAKVLRPFKNKKIRSIDPCDLLCTHFEYEPVCASNGLCIYEFANKCMLDVYNCKNPQKKFSLTKYNRCQIRGLNLCKDEEL